MSSSNSRRVALDKRRRTETSCDICKQRKQKCDRPPGQSTCRYCRSNELQCAVTHVRKKRIFGSLEGLGTRIELLESLVKGLVPEADLSSNDEMRRLGTSLGIPLPVEEAEAPGEDRPKTFPGSSAELIVFVWGIESHYAFTLDFSIKPKESRNQEITLREIAQRN